MVIFVVGPGLPLFIDNEVYPILSPLGKTMGNVAKG